MKGGWKRTSKRGKIQEPNQKIVIRDMSDVIYGGVGALSDRLIRLLRFHTLNGSTRAYKTGYLHDSWDAEVIQDNESAVKIRVYSDAYYAPYIEYGHHGPNGKGWVKPRPIVRYSVLDLKHYALPQIMDKVGKLTARLIFAKLRGGHVKGKNTDGMRMDWLDHWTGQRGTGPKQRTWSISTKDFTEG